jgi:multidrug efflux pump subunit AcrB
LLKAIYNRPKIVLLVLTLLFTLGLLTFFQLPQREIPEININVGQISTIYPGATPEQVERLVTVPLEGELGKLDGISSMTSVSSGGFSLVTLEVADGIDLDTFFNDVRRITADVSAKFPDDVLSIEVKEDLLTSALSSYHLVSENRQDLIMLEDELENWQTVIESINGVAGTAIKGLQGEEIVLTVDSNSLAEKQLLLPDVLLAIESELSPVPLGQQQIDDLITQLSISGIEQVDDLKRIYVGSDGNGDRILLEDIATLEVEPTPIKDLISVGQLPALSFTIFLEDEADIPSTQQAVDQKMEQLAEGLPETILLQPFYAQSDIVDAIFQDLFISFVVAVLAVVIVTLLGFTPSAAILVALTIPLSIAISLIPLPYNGVDLNQISIIGFIIALGIIVDDAIVVNDNIDRRYHLGDGPLDGAINGTKEVSVSIITSTLAIVFTFLPLAFLSGSGGDFIRALPTVLIATIITSTIISITFVPIYRIWQQKKRGRQEVKRIGFLGNFLDRLADWYGYKVLANVVKKPFLTSAIGLLFCTAAYGLIPLTPVELFPSADRDEVTVTVTLPIGTTLQKTEDMLKDMASYLEENDDTIYESVVYAGTGLPPLFGDTVEGAGENTGQLLIRIERERQSAEEAIDRWTTPLQQAYPDAMIQLGTIEAGPPVGAPIAIQISGPDLNILQELNKSLQASIERMESSGSLMDDVGTLLPTIVYEPELDIFEKYGLRVNDAAEQIRLVTDGIPLGDFDDGTVKRDLIMKIDGTPEGERVDLSSLTLPSMTLDGRPEQISLDKLLTEVKTEQIQRIPHAEGERTITLRVFPEGDARAELEVAIEEEIDELLADVGPDYSISIGGETEAQTDFFIEVAQLFLIVVFLIYFVMALQFNSLMTPLLIMSTVYLAISGAIVGLFITQTGLGFMAMMGIVSLAGIVVRNSVVLIEFVEQGLQSGLDVNTAVQEAGRSRLRPIFLTAITAIAALVPIAVSGDVLFTPLAISIISGISVAFFLTLLIVPALYTVIVRRRLRKQ